MCYSQDLSLSSNGSPAEQGVLTEHQQVPTMAKKARQGPSTSKVSSGGGGGKRKRVRFVESDQDEEGGDGGDDQQPQQGAAPPTKRVRTSVVSYVPRASDMLESEKAALWIRPEDREEIRAAANEEALLCRKADNKMILRGQSHFCFRETYSNVYAVCNLTADEDQDACTIVSPEILAFMATGGIAGAAGSNSGGGRGLEDRTAPRVAVERRLLRAQQIRATLQAAAAARSESKMDKFENNNDNDERIARVARSISRPSRKFAETLGLVDATAAIMVYTENASQATTTPSQQQCGLPEKKTPSTVSLSSVETDSSSRSTSS